MWQEYIVFGILFLTIIVIGYRLWQMFRGKDNSGCKNCDLFDNCQKQQKIVQNCTKKKNKN